MKHLNRLCAVCIVVLVCLAQLVYAQNPYPSNVTHVLPAPPVGVTYHSSGHVPPQGWELGQVFERVYDSQDIRPYTGEIYWEALRSNSGNWDVSWDDGLKIANATNEIRVPNGTMHAGDIYWLIAERDGEWHVGRGSLNAPSVPSSVEIWSYAQPVPLMPCPSNCHEITGPHFNLTPGFIGLDFTNNIYLPPRSTVSVTSVPVGSKDNLMVRYVNDINGVRYLRSEKRATASNPLNNPSAVFHVNYSPLDFGFEVHYDGCWHPIPRKLNPCTSLCFEVNSNILPLGRVARTLMRYAVPLVGAKVWVFNSAGTVQYTRTDDPIIANGNGVIQFTPPAGLSYILCVITTDNLEFIVPAAIAPTSPVALPQYVYTPTHTPVLTSPKNGATYDDGSTVSFSWNVASVPNQTVGKYHWYIAHESDSNWSGYDVGTSRALNVGVTGVGNWYWFVRAYNTSGYQIAESVVRVFEIASEERGDASSKLVGTRSLVVQDENGNVLVPTQGSERKSRRISLNAANDDRELIGRVGNLMLCENRMLLDPADLIQSALNSREPENDFASDTQGDWFDWLSLFVTPEELYFYYLFGGYDDL